MPRAKSIKFPNTLTELEPLFDELQRILSNYALNSGGLTIKQANSVKAKTVNDVYYIVDGQLYKLAAGDMADLSGTVSNGKYNVYVFTVNANGDLATRMGTEAGTLGGVEFPTIPEGEVVIGFVIIHPTGTGNFVGGTTPLDDSTVVPNAVYVNTPLPFLPGISVL